MYICILLLTTSQANSNTEGQNRTTNRQQQQNTDRLHPPISLPDDPSEVSVGNFHSTHSLFDSNLRLSQILNSQSLTFNFGTTATPAPHTAGQMFQMRSGIHIPLILCAKLLKGAGKAAVTH